MDYRHIPQPPEELQNQVLARLRIFNHATNPSFYAKLEEPGNVRPLRIFAFRDDGSLAGGVLAQTQLTWLKTEILVVDEADRNQGVGRELMHRAESEARERGCVHAYVDTMGWQAHGFYQKLGYRIAGGLPDWGSHGHSKYFLIKSLRK
jgi:GNAT superfamily N-acetyltransferase